MAELVFQKKKGHDELSLQAQQPTSISRSAQEIDEEACQGRGAREQLKTFWAWATVVSAYVKLGFNSFLGLTSAMVGSSCR